MNIAVFLDLVPQEYLEVKKTTTIRSIKSYLQKYNNIEKTQFLINDQTESKILDTDKFDNYNLSSIWKNLNNPAIYLYTPNQFKYASKDVILKIMDEMDDSTLLNFCKTNDQRDSEGVLYCNNEIFWENRTFKNFGEIEKNPDRTWKNLYLNIIYFNENKNFLWKLYKNNKNLDLIDFFTKNYIDKYKLNYNLFQSAKANNRNLTNYFISKGADDLNMALQKAAEFGDKELIDFLISKGADDWDGALIRAIIREDKDKELIDFFISKGANNWNGALIRAIIREDKELIDFFISKGANNWNGALHAAIRIRDKELIDFFISKGANNWNGALHAAIRIRDKELIDFFISK